ncbi:MAG: ATP-binding protein [Myxococcota bacterium]
MNLQPSPFWMLDPLPIGALVVDSALQVLAWNRRLEDWTGIPSSQIVGTDLTERFPHFGEHHYSARLRQVFVSRSSVLFSAQLHPGLFAPAGGGRERIQHTTVVPLHSPTTGETLALFAVQDVTEPVERERELRQARRAVERAALEKERFLASMSHDLRTPMTAILGYAELLLEDGDITSAPEKRLRAIQVIRRNGRHLLDLINDILDLSKIEAGGMRLERLDVSPFEVVADVHSLMMVQAEAKGIELRIELDGALPRSIRTDPTRLRQILTNLVGNSVKFTERGHVTVHLGFDRGSSELRFCVVDTGVGIAPEKLPLLFQPYRQADRTTTRRFGGTGLGLSICKLLAEHLGGRIEVESQPGRGSEFRLYLPVDASGPIEPVESSAQALALRAWDPSTQRPPPSPTELACHILFADDSLDNRRLVGAVLRRHGATLDLVEDGHQAVLRTLVASDAGRPYDVIMLDMQMPVLDGLDATRELRRRGCDVPIVALTANDCPEERNRCLSNGFSAFVPKPIDRELLIRTLAELVRGKDEPPEG